MYVYGIFIYVDDERIIWGIVYLVRCMILVLSYMVI